MDKIGLFTADLLFFIQSDDINVIVITITVLQVHN